MSFYRNRGLFLKNIFNERVISLGYFLLVCRKKKLYLRIGEGGSPIVCGKNEAKVFDDIKAQNVLDHLPKVLQKMNFVKEPIVQSELNISDEEEIPRKKTVIVEKTVVKNTSYNKKKKKIIKNTSYKAPQNVMNWVDRVTQCNDLFLDAEERRRELLDCLSNTDKNLSNILHKIELEDDMNACMGFMQYKKIRECLRRRRIVKDEMYILDVILAKPTGEHKIPSSQKILGSVKHLENRVFKVRETEDIEWLEFEITIENLLYILANANCYKGKGLEGEFVYGWSGKDLVLMPVKSPDYKQIAEFNKIVHNNECIKAKDLVLGATYLTKDDEQWIYMGRFETYGGGYEWKENGEIHKSKNYRDVPIELIHHYGCRYPIKYKYINNFPYGKMYWFAIVNKDGYRYERIKSVPKNKLR